MTAPGSSSQLITADTERIARDLRQAAVATMTNAELHDRREVLQYDAIDPGFDDASNDLGRFMAREELDLIDATLGRRLVIAGGNFNVPSPNDPAFTRWSDLAARLRDALPVPDALERIGWPMKRVGRDGQGRDEYAGACVVCGGRDRFRAWSNPNSRYWCRRCETRGDVVSLWRLTYDLDFVEACRALAGELGINVPGFVPRPICVGGGTRDESFTPDIEVLPLRRDRGKGRRVTAVEIVAGRMVAR